MKATIEHFNILSKPFLFLSVFALIIISCQKREYSNPYDDSVDPSSWAPYDLRIEDISLTEKKLTWECDAEKINAFIVDRKVGNNDWQIGYKEVPGSVFELIDSDIIPDPELTYIYRVQARAGSNYSSFIYVEEEFYIPIVSGFHIELISLNEISLTWDENINGEEGFKIDRKIGNGQWEVSYAQTPANFEGYIDSDFTLNNNIYYRIYAFVDTVRSDYFYNEVNSSIPPPSNLNLSMKDMQKIELSWDDNCIGEQGYIIDRRLGEANWEIAYATVNEDINSYHDNYEFTVGEIVYYKVYAFLDIFQSTSVVNSINAFICGVDYNDIRDGKYYNTVQIGNQCWMAENLNFQTANSWCYNDNAANCVNYGRLYSWDELMDGASSSNSIPSGVSGLCPDKWHVPSHAEWEVLINYVGGELAAGEKLKSSEGWYGNGNGSDEYGFAGLPAGYRGKYGAYLTLGSSSYFWTSTGTGNVANSWKLSYFTVNMETTTYEKVGGFSVRCVWDN